MMDYRAATASEHDLGEQGTEDEVGEPAAGAPVTEPSLEGRARTAENGLWIALLLGIAVLLALCVVLTLVAYDRAPVGAPG